MFDPPLLKSAPAPDPGFQKSVLHPDPASHRRGLGSVPRGARVPGKWHRPFFLETVFCLGAMVTPSLRRLVYITVRGVGRDDRTEEDTWDIVKDFIASESERSDHTPPAVNGASAEQGSSRQ